MRLVLAAKTAVFVSFDAIRIVFFVFHRRIIPPFTDRARHRNNVSHLLLLFHRLRVGFSYAALAGGVERAYVSPSPLFPWRAAQ
jgi:hypothetical protein